MKLYVISGNPKNTVLNQEYADKVIEYFRKISGWKVLPGTRIYNDLTEFSKRYSEEKRDVVEVVTIFRITFNI
jgi:hypothetical protein